MLILWMKSHPKKYKKTEEKLYKDVV